MAEKIKVLIVEDEFLVARLIGRNLERFFGYEICGPVATGEQAIARTEEDNPDIVLMDIQLASEMTGIEAAREIQTRRQIPIIFVTGYASSEYITQCLELTSATVLEKPLGPVEIHTAIQSVVNLPV